ncbi:hypothetical protein [Limnohabitans sp.]|uniref:hypothetical protein n=1 Tax=Limnohabitans sp. TaxID=1907725 RepID=UPI00286F0C84|nr:hypothetical protein [Limnohabitans sp.]
MMHLQSNQSHWRWTLCHAWARMPWRQWSALWLVLGVAVLYALFVYPLYGQRSALQEQMRTQATSIDAHRPKAPERQEQLGAFYEYFPAESQMVAILAKLHDAAPRRNLSLPQGEYRLIGAGSGSSLSSGLASSGQASSAGPRNLLMRYEIVLPVKGNYQDIRGYVSDVLMEQPGIALDALTFTRENNARVGVDAELHFTLYVRAGI